MSAVQKLGRLFPLRYRIVHPAEEHDLGSLTDVPDRFVPTNPSLAHFGGRYVANIRCVNYRLDHERTLKSRFLVGNDWLTQNRVIGWSGSPEEAVCHPAMSDRLGAIEDVRFLALGNRLFASGSYHRDAKAGMELFEFDEGLNLLSHELLPSPFGFGQEKNWAPFEKDGELYFVYALDPLIVLKPDDSEASYSIIHGQGHDPKRISFRTGGSSQGIAHGDGWLFIFHRRRVQPLLSGTIYLHYFVWISRDFKTVRKGKPFVIGRPAVHFVGGMVQEGEELLISYGRSDSNAWLARFAMQDLPIPRI